MNTTTAMPINFSDPDTFLFLLFQLGIALGIGILIGLERQLSHRDQKFSVGGIRTCALVAILGFLSGVLGTHLNQLIPVVCLLGLAVFLTFSHYMLIHSGRRGITSEISLVITYLLGLAVQLNMHVFAVAVALIVSVLMSIKPKIEYIVKQITEEELFAVFKFLVVSVLVLPLLHNTPIDLFGTQVINPREVWTVVVLVLTLSFVGYVLIKFWGPSKGIMLTGFLGGFVSSTVVTWIFSKKSQNDPENGRVYALATLLAISIMFLRIEILAQLINGNIGKHLLIPLAILLITGLLTVALIKKYFGLGANGKSPAVAMGNPFNLGDAVKFGFLYSVILILVKVANDHFGNAGVYVISALSGVANVDAIVISMARLGGDNLPTITALNAILLAAHSNNIVKLGISLANGSREYKTTMALGIGLIFLSTAVWASFASW